MVKIRLLYERVGQIFYALRFGGLTKILESHASMFALTIRANDPNRLNHRMENERVPGLSAERPEDTDS